MFYIPFIFLICKCIGKMIDDMENDESNIIWLTCPDCGSKIGIMLTVGKTKIINEAKHEVWPPQSIEEKLASIGIDLELVDIRSENDTIIMSPKKFLGDLWGPINDAVRDIGGFWVRDGRDSHWVINKTDLE